MKKVYRVRYLKKADGARVMISEFPNFDRTGSISGMKKLFYGKSALLVRCGAYIYNVTADPSIYWNLAK